MSLPSVPRLFEKNGWNFEPFAYLPQLLQPLAEASPAMVLHSFRMTLDAPAIAEYHDGVINAELFSVMCLVHDIGKARVPSSLLHPDVKFGLQEHLAMAKHVDLSVEMLREVKGANTEFIQEVVRRHHMYQGEFSHPDRASLPPLPEALVLIEDRVELYARILALVDSADAKTWRKPRPGIDAAFTPNEKSRDFRHQNSDVIYVVAALQSMGRFTFEQEAPSFD